MLQQLKQLKINELNRTLQVNHSYFPFYLLFFIFFNSTIPILGRVTPSALYKEEKVRDGCFLLLLEKVCGTLCILMNYYNEFLHLNHHVD